MPEGANNSKLRNMCPFYTLNASKRWQLLKNTVINFRGLQINTAWTINYFQKKTNYKINWAQWTKNGYMCHSVKNTFES